jgi:hypothetical protein
LRGALLVRVGVASKLRHAENYQQASGRIRGNEWRSGGNDPLRKGVSGRILPQNQDALRRSTGTSFDCAGQPAWLRTAVDGDYGWSDELGGPAQTEPWCVFLSQDDAGEGNDGKAGATEATGRGAHDGTEVPAMVLASSRGAVRDSSNAADALAATPDGYGVVTITSDPDGAEIFVDDKFVGNATAKLRLAAGDHRIVLKCGDCTTWRRNIQVLRSSQVNLNADLKSQ